MRQLAKILWLIAYFFGFLRVSFTCVEFFDCKPPPNTSSWINSKNINESAKLKKKLNQEPSDFHTRVALIKQYIKLNQLNKAERLLNTIFELEAKNPLTWLSYFQLLKAQKAYTQAKAAIFRAYLLSQGKSEEINFEFSFFLVFLKQTRDALFYSSLSLKKHNSIRLRFVKALALLQINKFLEAETIFIQLRQELPNFANFSINLAKINCRLNQEDDLLHNLRQAAFAGYSDLNQVLLDPCLIPYTKKNPFNLVFEMLKENNFKKANYQSFQKL